MDNNIPLNIDALTKSRQDMLANALAGHRLTIIGGRLEEHSRSSLGKIGLTEIEIQAIEKVNGVSEGVNRSLIIQHGSASSENNPFKKESWSPEMQRQVADSNPAQAVSLMREAGILR